MHLSHNEQERLNTFEVATKTQIKQKATTLKSHTRDILLISHDSLHSLEKTVSHLSVSLQTALKHSRERAADDSGQATGEGKRQSIDDWV
jgi:hypothetical protein